jgi:PAS domain S-box-containing protein
MTPEGTLVISSVRDITERMQAKEAIQESEGRLRRLIDALPVCIAYVDSEQIYRLNNRTYEEWIGRERSEITGRHVKEVLGEKIYAAAQERIEAVLSGQTITFEAAMPIVGGGVRHVMATYAPEFGGQGDVRGYFVLVTDISERKRAEEAIQKREEQFRKIFDHSNDAIFLIDPVQDAIVDANPRACEMLGYSREELLSLKISDIHPNEMPALMAFAHSVFKRGHGWTDELSCRTKNGNFLPAEISASTVDIDGQDCMIALIRDTTERKEAEERIQREAARADALAHVAARLNAHLTLDAVLNAVCEETALALEAQAASVLLHDEARGELCLAATFGLPPEYYEDYTPLPRSLYDRYAEQQGPLIILRDAQAEPSMPNAELYAENNIRTIVAHSLIREGQLVGTLNVYSFDEPRTFDEHELALLRGLVNQAAQAIENAQLRQQAELAAVMEERGRLARELHDSVTQSLYSLTLLAEGYQRSARAGKLERPEESLIELGEIAQQALKEMRLLVHELRPLALQREGLLGALHQRLSAVEKRSGVEARLVAEDVVELPPPVEEALYRIAQEALNNALKHGTASSVTLYFRANDRRVELEVMDDGRGFDLNTIDEQWGMGLVSMRERAEKLGGTLTVQSAPGEGTTVMVSMETSP